MNLLCRERATLNSIPKAFPVFSRFIAPVQVGDEKPPGYIVNLIQIFFLSLTHFFLKDAFQDREHLIVSLCICIHKCTLELWGGEKNKKLPVQRKKNNLNEATSYTLHSTASLTPNPST